MASPLLEHIISSERQEATQIARRVSELLATFDTLVLGGYSPEREEQLNTSTQYSHLAFSTSLFQGREDVSSKINRDILLAQYADRSGEEREAFLYGLRRRLLWVQEEVSRAHDMTEQITRDTDIIAHLRDRSPTRVLNVVRLGFTDVNYKDIMKFQLGLSLRAIQGLEGLSSAYREIYTLMGDIVNEQTQRQQIR